MFVRRSKAKTFSFICPRVYLLHVQIKVKLNETKKFFKVPDPKNNRDSCSRWLHNIGNAKWNINNFEPKLSTSRNVY